MSTVSFKRSPNVNNIPIVDGQLIFDETNNKIYMDNGNQRLQYGGDVSLIENIDYATRSNAFSAVGAVENFTQKLSVIDNKNTALENIEEHMPLGCLAFKSVIGTSDYSVIDNTVSDSLITLKNNITSINNQFTNQLTANNNSIYMDYHDGKYGYNTDPNRGADTFNPFSSGPLNDNWVRLDSTTISVAGCHLIVIHGGWIDRINWGLTQTIYVNGTAIPQFYGVGGTYTREDQICKQRTAMAFINLEVGDVVTARQKGIYDNIVSLTPAIWRYEP